MADGRPAPTPADGPGPESAAPGPSEGATADPAMPGASGVPGANKGEAGPSQDLLSAPPASEPANAAEPGRKTSEGPTPSRSDSEPRSPAGQNGGPAIVAEGLTKRYGEFTAVDHLDLQVAAGEVFGLLGPNGAGKTTTILMLLGLSELTEGTARVAGLDPARSPLEVKRLVGYVPDNVGFYPDLSGRQNLAYTAQLNSISPSVYDERIGKLVDDVGLTEAADAAVGTYSRGMRQRLGIADALVKSPQVLILDEPTIGIDPEGIKEILDLIIRLRDENKVTVLLSSHLLSQVQAVCDRVGIFVGGRLVAQGPVSQLAAQHGIVEGEIEVTAGDWEAAGKALWSIPGVKDIRREENFWVVVAQGDIRAQIAKAFAERGVPLLHLRRREQSLDDIYSRYFQNAGEAPVTRARRPGRRTA